MSLLVPARSFWAPLYFEPLVPFGERFCVAIVVVWEAEAKVIVAPGINRLRCLFGHEGDFLIAVVNHVAHDFEELLRNSEEIRKKVVEFRKLETGVFSTRGFYCGEFMFAKGDKYDLVAHNALSLCSSFATPSAEPAKRPRVDRVVSSVRKIVVVTHRHLAKCFNVQAPTFTEGTQPHFGFIGLGSAANMGRLNSHFLSEHFPHFQAKAMDLERLRENRQKNLFDDGVNRFSLLALLVKPEEEDQKRQVESEERLQETLAALSEIARQRELRFMASENVSDLSRTLVELEEAK